MVPFILGFEPGDDPQQRRLAAAGWPEERDEAAVRYVERDPIECGELAEALDDAGEREIGIGRGIGTRS